MVSHETVEPTPYDHNAAVAAAGENQARVNAERELHDKYHLDPRGKLGLYAASDIRDAFDRVIAAMNAAHQTSEPSTHNDLNQPTSLPDEQQ